MRSLPAILLSVVLSVGALPVLAPASASAAAAEVVTRPDSGVFEIEGRGYGHGRGMSQWGAYGGASAGLDWKQVLAFYYPGTQRRILPDAQIRVWISADTDSDTRVVPAPGLSITSAGRRATLPTGARYESWRVLRSGGSLVLQRQNNGTWYAYPGALPEGLGADATFTAASGTVRLVRPDTTRQDLRGGVRAVKYGSGSGVRTVAVMTMENYLRGVVPSEMPASWHRNAVRAQAVAARSYGARLRDSGGNGAWHTCDTTACQVFKGTATYRADGSLVQRHEHPLADDAIAHTREVVVYATATQIALTEFSAANGGWTAPGGPSYQVAKRDGYDGLIPSVAHAWTEQVPVSKLESAFPAIGTFQRMSVDQRNGYGEWGGRVLRVTLTGTRGSATATGEEMRWALGLRSGWFRVLGGAEAFPRDWNGDEAADLMAVDGADRLWLYPGQGDSSFSKPVQIGRGWDTRDLVTQVGDWDGDGAQDLLARSPRDGRLWLYPGDGRGGFGLPGVVGTGWGVVDLILGPGDWDGDGFSDVLWRRADDGTLWLHPGDGTGGFGSARQIGRGWHGVDLVAALGDVTGDDQPDLVARVGEQVSLYPSDGRGGWGAPRVFGRGWDVVSLILGIGDVDGDGHGDLLARLDGGDLHLYPGRGDGTFRGGEAIGRGWNSFRVVA